MPHTKPYASARALAAVVLVTVAACAGEAVPPPAAPPAAPPPSAAASLDPTRAVVEGIVRGPDGAAVDGALVAVVSAADTAPPREAAAVVSEGGGRFRFAGLPPGKYAITATAPGLTAAYVDAFDVAAGATRAGVEARLGRDGRVARGVVVGPGTRPVAGAVVRFARVSQVSGDIFLGRTDARGAYEVRLPKAAYGVAVEAPGLESPALGLRGETEDQTLDVTLTRAFPAAEPPPAEVTAWLKQAAVPLATVEAGHGFADLAPVGKMVGDARVVAMGEATHGTREFFQLKHRIFEYLVAERGFTAFAFEAPFAEAQAVDAYVRTGKGDPADAVAGLRAWMFDTEEMLSLVRWMRRYNEDPKHKRKLRFYGFDTQYPSGSAQALVAYLHRVDPGFEAEARRALVRVDDDFTIPVSLLLPDAERAATAAALEALVKRMDEHRDAYVKRAGAEAFALARLHAATAWSGAETWALPLEAAIPLRDRTMADTVRALLDLEGPSGKMALWAANDHVEREATWFGGDTYRPMGNHLAQALGDAMVVLGFAAGGGLVPGHGAASGDGARASGTSPCPRPRRGRSTARWPRWTSRSWRSTCAGHRARARSPTGSARGSRRATRAAASPTRWSATWKDTSRPAAGTTRSSSSGRPPPPAPTRAGARRHTRSCRRSLRCATGAWRRVPPGELPAGWQRSAPGGHAPYQVLASTERPEGGKRCAVIARERSPWAWGTAALRQKVDAAPFRGKRVRLRAAVRAEVSGVGQEAHLYVRVARSGASDWMGSPGDGTLAIAGTFDRPIVDRAWRTYDVEVDVPQEAGTLTVGAALSGNGKAFVDEVSLSAVGEAK